MKYLFLLLLVVAFAGDLSAATCQDDVTTCNRPRGGPPIVLPIISRMSEREDIANHLATSEIGHSAQVISDQATRENDDVNTEHETQQLSHQLQRAQSDRFNTAVRTNQTSAPETRYASTKTANVASFGHLLFPAIIEPFVSNLYTSSTAQGRAGKFLKALTNVCRVGVPQSYVSSLSAITGQGCRASQRVGCAMLGGAACLRKNGRVVISARGGGGAELQGGSKILADSSLSKNPSHLFAIPISGGGGGHEDTRAIAAHIALVSAAPDAPESYRAQSPNGPDQLAETFRGGRKALQLMTAQQRAAGGDAAYEKSDLKAGGGSAMLFDHKGKQLATLISGGGGGMYDALEKCAKEKGMNPTGGQISQNELQRLKAACAARTAEHCAGEGNANDVNKCTADAQKSADDALAAVDRGETGGVDGGGGEVADSISAYLQSDEWKQFVQNNDTKKLAAVFWKELDHDYARATIQAAENVRNLDIPVLIASIYPGNYQVNYRRYVAQLKQEYKKLSLNDYFIEFDFDNSRILPTTDGMRFAGLSNALGRDQIYSHDAKTLIALMEKDKIDTMMADNGGQLDLILGSNNLGLSGKPILSAEHIDPLASLRGLAAIGFPYMKASEVVDGSHFKAIPIAAGMAQK